MIPPGGRGHAVFRLTLGTLIAGCRLQAGIPDELQPALDRLSGQDVVSMRIELQSTLTTGEAATATTAGAIATLRVTALPERMDVRCPLDQIQEANESNPALRGAMRQTMGG
jgi:hypothetical protein